MLRHCDVLFSQTLTIVSDKLEYRDCEVIVVVVVKYERIIFPTVLVASKTVWITGLKWNN